MRLEDLTFSSRRRRNLAAREARHELAKALLLEDERPLFAPVFGIVQLSRSGLSSKVKRDLGFGRHDPQARGSPLRTDRQ
jgi:hypothetical protein